MKFLTFLPLALLLSVTGTALATDADKAISATTEQTLRDALTRLLPERHVDAIRTTPVAGLYEVTNGGRVYYITENGDFLLTGHLIDTRASEDLTAGPIMDAKKSLLAHYGDDMTINYGDKDLPYEIVVFTDIDCPYCRQMHQYIGDYNKAGIRVRYFLYPRAGLDSESFVKARNVWCADDRAAALTAAKNQQPVEARECETPIAQHLALGEELGINGTPTLMTTDAQTIPGIARAPERLAQLLQMHAAQQAQ
ncbi:MAG: DsbC family protein [Gammaproteobacteria bacterium]|nr:DsbC family protein [Gammaproteobacteria bacterium]MCP5135251.1 DsbC family protein [Gammaproteobacteria bacterium]